MGGCVQTTMRLTILLAAALTLPVAASAAIPRLPANPQIDKIVTEVSAKRIEATVRKLVSFGTRHTLSKSSDPNRGIGPAIAWAQSEFERVSRESGGRLEVRLDRFTQPKADRVPEPTELTSVMAILPGTTDPDRIYVVSGHIDSCVCTQDVLDSTSDAPGADDDASGVAVVMELARVMATQRYPATIVFMAVVGEEQGLLGAAHIAETYKNRAANVAGMITNDIVGSSAGTPPGKPVIRLFSEGVPSDESEEQVRVRRSIGGENDAPSRQLARYLKESADRYVPGIEVRLVWRRDRYSRGGDHIPFLQRGYPAVRFTEYQEDYRHQHQRVRVENGVQYGDLPEFVDFDYVARVARVNGVGLASLATAPATPREVTIDGRLSSDTTLNWKPVPGATGYRVVWRDTAASLWTDAQTVGAVTTVTLPLSKDNYFFGVQSMDANGHVSLTSYPTPSRLRTR